MNTELIKHIGEGLSKTTPVCVQSRGCFHIFFSYMYDGYQPKDDDLSKVIAVWRLKPKQAPINNH
jgi:hypothetical protein